MWWNAKKINLKKINEKVYKLYNEEENLEISIKMKTPFGIELYNGKKIVNWELAVKNNYEYNSVVKLKELERLIKNNEEFENKIFTPFLKERRSGVYHLRSFINNEQTEIIEPNKNYEVNLSFDKIWIYGNRFGGKFNVKSIK
jgi:hypothetical protein